MTRKPKSTAKPYDRKEKQRFVSMPGDLRPIPRDMPSPPRPEIPEHLKEKIRQEWRQRAKRSD